MCCKIISVRAKEGKTPLIIIDTLLGEKRQKYTVNEGTYREIGCPLSGEVIDEDSLLAIAREDEQRRAFAKALNLLSYADNNKRTLMRKLVLAGLSRDASEAAVEECVRLGYIDEERQIERLVQKYALELLGPHKIIAKLVSRSYPSAQITKIMRRLEDAGEIDFKKSKEELLSAKLPEDADYTEKRKLLYKYGYIK